MTERSKHDRLLAILAARDSSRADRLLSVARPSFEGMAEELNRPTVEREPFLSAPALALVLDALDDTEESIARAAALIELLRWISNHRPLMEENDPREAIASSVGPDAGTSRDIHHLAAARELLAQSHTAGLDALIGELDARIDELRGPDVRHLWARGHTAQLVGTRGTAKENIGRWQALLAREISALVPDSTVERYASIADLLTLAGIETERQYVRVIVKYRKPEVG